MEGDGSVRQSLEKLLRPVRGGIPQLIRPALVNRIITNQNEVVFDPSKVVSNILVERGCGGFTTDISKAKALLATWGSHNPMIIRGAGVSGLTDVRISPEDAGTILAQIINEYREIKL